MAENDSQTRSSSTSLTMGGNDSNEVKDVEAQQEQPQLDQPLARLSTTRSKTPVTHAKLWKLVTDTAFLTDAVLSHNYRGSGTVEDPYVVEFLPADPRNPLTWPGWKKWVITMILAVATLAVSFVSSAFTGGIQNIMADFNASSELATLSVSLFVLGFAIGPLLWAPLSEMYGRQILFVTTFGVLTAFNAGGAGAQNIQTVIILRFFAGAFGSSPLTNAGGVIADMFNSEDRGLAMSIFASAPFLGPTLGPIVGGFVGQTVGWRWIDGVMAIFCGVVWIVGSFTIPETYSPVLLRHRAEALSKKTGNVYRSRIEIDRGPKNLKKEFSVALSRPWILLIKEPIVIILSIYMAIIYGTLFMMFGAFPIVFQQDRGWSQGMSGLAFIGILIGMISGVILTFPLNTRYARISEAHNGNAPPEARLPPAMIGACALPLGLFWFAWTNYPSIHWSVCIIGSAPFGFGMVLVFLSTMNYLIDSYTVYAASVLAANAVLRSLFGAAFPLFTKQMYSALGIHWASTIPAFLALACLPFPFLFFKHGAYIRKKCKYAAEAAMIMEKLRVKADTEPQPMEQEAVREEGVVAEGSQSSSSQKQG